MCSSKKKKTKVGIFDPPRGRGPSCSKANNASLSKVHISLVRTFNRHLCLATTWEFLSSVHGVVNGCRDTAPEVEEYITIRIKEYVIEGYSCSAGVGSAVHG